MSIDADLLLAARKLALERNTTVNAMFREYLVEMTEQQKRRAEAARRMEEIFADPSMKFKDRPLTRDEIYDRKIG